MDNTYLVMVLALISFSAAQEGMRQGSGVTRSIKNMVRIRNYLPVVEVSACHPSVLIATS